MTTAPKRRPALMSEAEVETCFAILARHIDPKPELRYSTPLDLLVAVVLSAQTTDRQVNKVTEKLWQECRTAEDYLALGTAGVEERIKSIGLFRNKAKSITGLCEKLLAEHGGEVPGDFDALCSLPGVGRKTANVVLNIAFGQPTVAVDTHVFRVANRLGLVRAPTPEKTELALLKRIPRHYRQDAHHYLILHGRYTCTARAPQCPACPVRELCRHPGKIKN